MQHVLDMLKCSENGISCSKNIMLNGNYSKPILLQVNNIMYSIYQIIIFQLISLNRAFVLNFFFLLLGHFILLVII